MWPASSLSQNLDGRRYWVYFEDRPPTNGWQDRLLDAMEPHRLQRLLRCHLAERDLVRESDRPLPPDRLRLVRQTGAKIHRTSRWFNAVSVEANDAQLSALRSLPSVKSVAPVAVWKRESAPVPPLRPDTEGSASATDFTEPLALLGVPQAQQANLAGRQVRIAVFDTGFDLNHPALAHISPYATYDFINSDSDIGFAETPNETCNGQPGCDARYKELHHGTAVLSLIAGLDPESGVRIGPAPLASFLLAKTENNFSETAIEEDNWVAALEWADSLGADIVSASLGYLTFDDGIGDHDPLRDLDGFTTTAARAASSAASRGILVCTAAGNNGPGLSSLVTPADAESILAVGAVDLTRATASFSSRGPTSDGRVKPDVVAPGVALMAANHSYADGPLYTSFSGTSAATPLVAGLAALVLESSPALSTESLRSAILQSADRASVVGSDPTVDMSRGWGIPDFCRANPLVPKETPDGSTGHLTLRVFPQPSDSEVQFAIGSPFDDNVTLTVYDAAGFPVRSLGPVPIPAGNGFTSCDLRWDGRNGAGRRAAGGVYFVVAESENGTARALIARTP